MNRRGGAWIAIICILVIGVSVTRMTKSFVSSGKAQNMAVAGAMEAGTAEFYSVETDNLGAGRSAMPGAGALADYVRSADSGAAAAETKEAVSFREAAPSDKTAGLSQADENGQTDGLSRTDEGGRTDNSSAAAGMSGEPSSQTGENAADGSVPRQAQSGQTSYEGAPEDEGVAGEAAFEGQEAETAVPVAEGERTAADTSSSLSGEADVPAENTLSVTVTDDAADTGAGENEAQKSEALMETVKSPLDPAVETESSDTRIYIAAQSYTYEELLTRLETASAQAEIYQEAQKDPNPGSVYIAAEQEWNLWDKELNLIYSSIRSKMDPEEAELLKHEEVEWIRERDLEADKAMLRSKNQISQNTDYLRASTDKTRERCYELMADYEEVLKREETQETQGIPN